MGRQMTPEIGKKYREKGSCEAWKCTGVAFGYVELLFDSHIYGRRIHAERSVTEDDFKRDWLPWRPSARA